MPMDGRKCVVYTASDNTKVVQFSLVGKYYIISSALRSLA